MQPTVKVRSHSPRGTVRRVAATPLPSSDRARLEQSRRMNAVAEAFARIRAIHRGRA